MGIRAVSRRNVFFLARPRLGQVGLPLIAVVVEQGPDVRLLVGRLWIRGGHPVSVVAKDEIIASR